MKYKHLTSEQRYYIYLERQKGSTRKSIAEAIGVSESTISRELRRNGGKNGSYNFMKAKEKADERSHRSPGNRAKPASLVWRVKQLIMDEQWSPSQISGYLHEKEGVQISHETIYKLIRNDGTGKLSENCRHRMKYCKSASRKHETKATNIKNRVSIHDRPAEADGKRFGDWEMDTIVGKAGKGVIVTLVERTSKKLLMARSPKGKDSKSVARLVVQLLMPFSKHVLSITTDNGSEFADHKYIAKKLHTSVYFAHPYSSWEKGLIENTNKLIRQFIPKDTDFSSLSDDYILHVQTLINRRPRKLLNFFSPKQIFLLSLHNSVAL
jgi:IS30 family transposase